MKELFNKKSGPSWLPSLEQLKARNIDFVVVDQYPGDVVIGGSGVFHFVINSVSAF